MEKNTAKDKKSSSIDEEVMQEALHQVVQKKLSLNKAAVVFQIPKSTLFSRLKNVRKELSDSQDVSLMMGLHYKEMVNKFAARQILTMRQEEKLVSYLLASSN